MLANIFEQPKPCYKYGRNGNGVSCAGYADDNGDDDFPYHQHHHSHNIITLLIIYL